MTKISLIPALLLLLSSVACGAPFTAGELLPTGEAGTVDTGSAGAASAPSTGGASGGGTSAAGFGGMAVAHAGDTGTSGGGMGGALSQGAPCADPVDTISPGYLALGTATCYRTREAFDTITCSPTKGWAERTLRVNGQLAVCDKKQAFPPAIDGYNYFEITGAPPGADWIRWSIAGTDGAVCWPLFARDKCTTYAVGDTVNYNGRNWVCSSPECTLCQQNASCEPSGLCPDGVVWTEEGTCQ